MNEPAKTHVAGISSVTSFTNRVLIIAAVAAPALIAWRLASVFILVFAGIVLAMVLRAQRADRAPNAAAAALGLGPSSWRCCWRCWAEPRGSSATASLSSWARS